MSHRIDSNRETCDCYKRRSGVVISTNSTDFPHIVFSARNLPLCLFPQSLYFVENRSDLSKAQKVKFSCDLSTGDQIEYIMNECNIAIDYTRVAQFDKRVHYTDKILLEDYIIISPEIPRRCWSIWLSGFVSAPLDLLSDAIPNIVYEAYLAVDAYLTDPELADALPRAHCTFELGKIIRPVPNNSHVDEIYHAEWNLPDNRGLFQDFFDSNELVGPYERRPKPPREQIPSAMLYVLDNRQLVWPNRPMHKVVMGVLPTEDEKKLLIEGRVIKADMFFCKFNNFYVVHRYTVVERDCDYPQLVTRQKIDAAEFAGHTEYFLQLTYSNYNGFFVNKDLKNCLIDDPEHLLLKSILEKKNVFYTWVRLNKFGRAARFSVTSLLDDAQNSNSPYVIQNDIPNLVSTGFVVNICTGSIFCDAYPTYRIFLMVPDRIQVYIGEYIQFEANFFSSINAFVIFNFAPMKRMFSRPVIASYRGFLFKERLNCTKVKACVNLYESTNFGLVTDSEEIIWTKVCVENIDMPECVDVYVEENLDKNRSTFFNVYALHLEAPAKDVETDSCNFCPPTNTWWKSNDPQKCKCRQIKEVCEELISMRGCLDYYSEELSTLFDRLRAAC